MSDERLEAPRNTEIDPAARGRLEAAREAYRRKLDEGTVTEQDAKALFEELRRFAHALGWDDPEIREQIARGLYRGPCFVILDAFGYDRDLARHSVGSGWASLIDEVFDLRDRDFPSVRIVQVKEKWGALTVYTAGDEHDHPAFSEFLAAIRERSYYVCEECGAPGVLRGGGWYRTLCDAHAEGRAPLPEPEA